MAQRDEAYVQAAQNILTPSQIERFKAFLKQNRDGYESYIKLEALRDELQD